MPNCQISSFLEIGLQEDLVWESCFDVGLWQALIVGTAETKRPPTSTALPPPLERKLRADFDLPPVPTTPATRVNQPGVPRLFGPG